MEDDYVPIDVDLNGDKEVVEIDSKHAKKTTSVHACTYKPMADGKPFKHKENSHPMSKNIINFLNLLKMVPCFVSVRNASKFTMEKAKMGLET